MISSSEDQVLTSLLRLADGCAILYVEDEPDIRTSMTELLETLFSRVVTAENGEQALELYGKGEFELVITDINMPRMTGIELIQSIQQTNPAQAFLVTSAYSDSTNLIPLINLGIGSFILKPLNWKILLQLLHKELSSALASRQEARYQQRLEKEIRMRTDELRETQQQIVRLQEAKDNMLALISHELRTPLNGILGFTELLRSSLNDPEPLSFLDHVEESARRLERSTRKALDFSSLSTGKRLLNRAEHSLMDLLTTAKEQVMDRLEPVETLSIVNLNPSGDDTLFTDAELTVEVFRNLLENVLKYAGRHPVVQVLLTKEGVWDHLSFRDSGPGFSDGMLKILFQPFSTGNIMHHSEGMGLGLALVDVIMLTLGGRVEAHNHPEGGAEVRLRFLRKS